MTGSDAKPHEIRVLIVDDQSLIRQGLTVLLAKHSGIAVAGEAINGKEACRLVNELRPDVVLMDLRMPIMNGIDACKIILHDNNQVKVIVLTTFDQDTEVVQALSAGASGYLLKDTPVDQIVAAIKLVYQGNSLLSADVLSKLINAVNLVKPVSVDSAKYASVLTEREFEIFDLIGQGKTNPEIADLLNLTEGRVKNYIGRIIGRIGARDRIHAVRMANGAS